MATTKKTKVGLEVLLVKVELKGIPEKALLKSRNMVQVDMVWPRPSIARKSAMREAAFRHGVCDFTGEPWTKRVVLREDVEDHCGFAVSVTEPVSIQKLRQFLRLTAKYALKMGADFMEKAMVGYADIASAPIDALAAMVGEKRAGLRLKKGVRLTQKLDASAVVLHDSHALTSNLWGAFGPVGRDLSGVRLHPACRGIETLRP